MYANVCVCSSNPTAGSKGQLKSQHIVSLETWQKNNKRPKKNLLNFSCLFQLFWILYFFFFILSLAHTENIFLLKLHIQSDTAASLCFYFPLQQPGGGFGFRQSLSAQHLRKQKRSSSFQLFSPYLIIWLTSRCITTSDFPSLFQVTDSHKSPSEWILWRLRYKSHKIILWLNRATLV